jgi:hypothetical protein
MLSQSLYFPSDCLPPSDIGGPQSPSLALAALRATNFSALSGAYSFDAQQNRKVDYDFMQPQVRGFEGVSISEIR